MADRPRKALILARGGRRLTRVARQALERIERGLPEGTQLQIWTELEIFALDGTVHELDAVALGHYGHHEARSRGASNLASLGRRSANVGV